MDADLKLEVGKLREDYFARAKHRIDEVEKTEAAAAEEDMARWDKKRDQALAEVERAYACLLYTSAPEQMFRRFFIKAASASPETGPTAPWP